MGLFAECEYEEGCRVAPEEAERLPPEHFASPMTFQMAPTAWPVAPNAHLPAARSTGKLRVREKGGKATAAPARGYGPGRSRVTWRGGPVSAQYCPLGL